MKLLAAIILTALLSFVAGLYFPWWSIAVVAFLIALLIHQKSGKAFWSGFLGIFLLWAGLAWWIDMKNNSVLSKKIASLLHFGGNSIVLIIVTGVIGGVVAGLAAMSGSYLKASKGR